MHALDHLSFPLPRKEGEEPGSEGSEIGTRWVHTNGSEGGFVAESAFIDPTAHIDRDAIVGPGAVVGPGIRIKAGYCMMRGDKKPRLMRFDP